MFLRLADKYYDVVEFKIPSIPFVKKKGKKDKEAKGVGKADSADGSKKAEGTETPSEISEEEECKQRVALYRRIIERYREMIEKSETKTVTELRSLIVPKDAAVVKLRDGLLKEFRPYIFEQHFEEVARKAYAFVLDKVANEELPVDFWLEPRDVVELRVADEMDKAVLLCSLLRSLECESAKVIVESNGERHVFVGFEFKGKYMLMDPAHRVMVEGKREDVLKKRFGSGRKQVYEFNDKEYDEIVGAE